MKKTASSTRWLDEHANDHYVKQAKQLGYRSRAAFKLLELHQKDFILKRGICVVDLGSAPGGWSIIASQKIGKQGRVFALDILPMDPIPDVVFLQGDFNDDEVVGALLKRIDNCPIDLVMSDISPNISGIATVDQCKAFQLNQQALEFAKQVLKPGGHFLVKVFQGSGFESFLKEMRLTFSNILIRKPNASRNRSKEVYIIGIGLKP